MWVKIGYTERSKSVMAISESEIQSNLVALNRRIERACQAAGRRRDQVELIAVSKTKPVAAVRHAYASGLRHFGENYVDEAVAKIAALKNLQAIWHFIGRIQSNKTRLIAENFDWVHTVERIKIARRLNDQCPPGKKINVLIQVNVDADPDKAGVSMDQCEELLQQLLQLPNLLPRGLMTILARTTSVNTAQKPDSAMHPPLAAEASYRTMAHLAENLRSKMPEDYPLWDTLSMGMTADLEQAVSAGATQLRIGTALFGARQ